MKKVYWIVGAIIGVTIVLGGIAGGFYAGMTYQKKQVDNTRARFESLRGSIESGLVQPSGGLPGGNFSTPGQAPDGINMVRGGGIIGQVKALEGDELQISTATEVSTVRLSEDTVIQMTVTVENSELEPGVRVMVVGEPDADGVIQARQVSILDANSLNGMMPAIPYLAPGEGD